MNEQLQGALSVLLEKTVTGLSSGAELLREQLPEVVEQLLLWHASKSLILSVLTLICILVWVIIEVKVFREFKNDIMGHGKDGSEAPFLYFIIGSIARLVVICIIYYGSFISLDWLQIWIAPKVWLIEYASTLVSK